MSLRRRKKAIAKVVKLLNLATSANTSESTMALRHAESIILQNGLTQGDIPMYQLCDRATLFKVSWNGTPRHAKATQSPHVAESYVAPRRFSEKPVDPNKAYASARTILDDIEQAEMDLARAQQEAEQQLDTATPDFADEAEVQSEVSSDLSETMENADLEAESTTLTAEAAAEQVVISDEPEIPVDQQSDDLSEVSDEPVAQAAESQDAPNESNDSMSNAQTTVEDSVYVNAERFSSYDNVINAANAFRPIGEQFKETLRNQYSSSNPDVPFEDDSYWNKVHGMLVDFDESEVLYEIESLEGQLNLAQESLKAKRAERAAVEQEEQRERTDRARIEQSFEEAIERAFQARARAYEEWEKRRSDMRVSSMRAEQDAQQGYQDLETRLVDRKEQYAQHLQLKEDYRAAKIMHELRRHLALAAKGDEQSTESYETVISIMSESGLSLRDLEFSDIRNKSLFIRLLERESALIGNVHDRELYTEEMLDKFLLASRQAEPAKPSENPVERVERLLKSIEGVGHFESQKVIEQVLRLMESHQISVRDLDFGCINKYSIFISLINWEAEQIHSISEREKFTSSVLEDYVQYSVMNPPSSQKA